MVKIGNSKSQAQRVYDALFHASTELRNMAIDACDKHQIDTVAYYVMEARRMERLTFKIERNEGISDIMREVETGKVA